MVTVVDAQLKPPLFDPLLAVSDTDVVLSVEATLPNGSSATTLTGNFVPAWTVG
jgi:hypothetical protein